MKLFKRICLALAIVFVGIQLLPIKTNQSEEASSGSFENTYKIPEDVKRILTISCYDCHSNNTNYPWYSKIQPMGWLIEKHINNGKKVLNFSEIGHYSNRKKISKLKSIISQVEKNEMPLASYLLIHHDAKLSKEDQKNLIDFFNHLIDE